MVELCADAMKSVITNFIETAEHFRAGIGTSNVAGKGTL